MSDIKVKFNLFGTNEFGYPSECELCKGSIEYEGLKVKKAFYRVGNEKRLMLIGQEPTIRKDKERVNVPLMLDDTNSQLYKWLRQSIFGEEFERMTLYATNIVKCSFNKPPSEQVVGGKKFLERYFINCQEHLKNEINSFKPTILLGLGEPVHIYLSQIFGEETKNVSMKNSFTGKFKFIGLIDSEHKFYYSPCLHIQNFRVAETYGDAVKDFKLGVKEILKR